MENKIPKDIYPISDSLVSHNSKFATLIYGSVKQVYELKKINPQVIRFGWITLRPIVDQFGELRNPRTPVVFFQN